MPLAWQTMTCQGINNPYTKNLDPIKLDFSNHTQHPKYHIIAGMMSWKKIILRFTVLVLPIVIANACNQAVCGSVVSKCLLTKSCKCDLKTCSCCKECFFCLSHLYNECCSCVDLCPKPNATGNSLSSKSHVEDLNEPIPGLFQALTVDPDPQERWTSFNFPVDFDVSAFNPKPEIKYHQDSDNRNSVSARLQANTVTLNCTVAYIAECSSWNKCRLSCQSMGATSYRWFHDGCCECIGDTCINYGINESQCQSCPGNKEANKEEDSLEDYDDYGQDGDDFDGDYLVD